MRSKLRNFLKSIVKVLAIWTLRKYQPSVIGVTGSVGKTSTKEAIYAVLREVRRVRMSAGNYNNEFGLPLAILGTWDTTGGFWFWANVIAASLARLIVRVPYPEILILEYGAQVPGDLKYLLGIARPMISVVTAVGEVPVHVEFYAGPEAVAREKARLVEVLPASGFAVLNGDDPRVRQMAERTRAHVITFGFAEGAEVRVGNVEYRRERDELLGITFKLEYGGSFVPVRMDHCFGRGTAYAAAAAAAIGIAFGMHLVRIAGALAHFEGPPHRMKLVRASSGAVMIDDAYNASPLSVSSALETLASLPARRRIAVLGDMLELGSYAVTAHEAAGRHAARVADVVFAIGLYAKGLAEAVRKNGVSRQRVFWFETKEEALSKIRGLIRKGDVVLVKASRALELETLVADLAER